MCRYSFDVDYTRFVINIGNGILPLLQFYCFINIPSISFSFDYYYRLMDFLTIFMVGIYAVHKSLCKGRLSCVVILLFYSAKFFLTEKRFVQTVLIS